MSACVHLPLGREHAEQMTVLLTEAAGVPVSCAIEVCPFCETTVLTADSPVPLDALMIAAAASAVLGRVIDPQQYARAINAQPVERPYGGGWPMRFLR